MTSFYEKMSALCKDLNAHKYDVVGNEQATKEHLIGPFFSELGWKRDPKTWRAEYDADFNGKRKGEKVDYAVLQNNEPIMLIECKAYSPKEKSLAARDGQLARYFAATSAKISVITNGVVYRFFTDLEKDNIQDLEPFFIFDCAAPTKTDIDALERFTAARFDAKLIREWASDHQFTSRLKRFLSSMVTRPNDTPGLAHYLLEHTYAGPRSQRIVQRVNEQIPDIMNEVLGEVIRDRFASASQGSTSELSDNGVVTTDEEKAAYASIQGILAGAGRNLEELTFVDKKNWMNVSHRRKGNWFVRLCFNEEPKSVLFRAPAEEIAKLVPGGTAVTSKGKNAVIHVDPRSLAHVAKAIIHCFDARAAAKDVGADEEDVDDTLGAAA